MYEKKNLCTILILFSYIKFLYISLFFGYKMFIFSSLLQGPPASVSWLRVLLRGAKSIRRQRFGLKKLDSRISFLAAGGPKSEFEVRTQVYTHLPTSGAAYDLLPAFLSNFVTGRGRVCWGLSSADWMIDSSSSQIGIDFYVNLKHIWCLMSKQWESRRTYSL